MKADKIKAILKHLDSVHGTKALLEALEQLKKDHPAITNTASVPKCSGKFVYSASLGRCILPLGPLGQEPPHECLEGLVYDGENCVPVPEPTCETGTFNPLTGLCE
jgi:hypothetical protein